MFHWQLLLFTWSILLEANTERKPQSVQDWVISTASNIHRTVLALIPVNERVYVQFLENEDKMPRSSWADMEKSECYLDASLYQLLEYIHFHKATYFAYTVPGIA